MKKVLPIAAIITTYNGLTRGFLRHAVESVLAQTCAPAEFVIIDDGSQDETAAYILEHYPEIKLITKPNGGPASARNLGVKSTISPLICYLDDDDVWLPEKLERQFNFFEDDLDSSELGLVFTGLNIIDEKSVFDRVKYPANIGYTWPEILLANNILAPSSSMIRRKVFDEIGLFSEDKRLIYVEDYEFWIRLSRKYKIKSMHLPLVQYREHGSQGSGNQKYITHSTVAMVKRIASQNQIRSVNLVASYHYTGATVVAIARGCFSNSYAFFKAAVSHQGGLILFLLRSIGFALRSFTNMQRAWRRIEYSYVLSQLR